MEVAEMNEQTGSMRRWVWRFSSAKDLRKGLEQYTAHLDDTAMSHYGEWDGGGESGGTEHMCAMRIRAEIDRCLDDLEYPFFARLLDLYYRRGMSCENEGWCAVARRLGLRGNPDSRWDRETFEQLLDMAVSRLWRVHERRWERLPKDVRNAVICEQR